MTGRPKHTKHGKRPSARPPAATTDAREPTPEAHLRPGFTERYPDRASIANEPLERPAPADGAGEHDYGSVPPDALEAPAGVERD